MKIAASEGKVANSDSDSNNEFEPDEDFLQEANDNMYSQWLRIRDKNHSLVSEKVTFLDFKNKAEKRC